MAEARGERWEVAVGVEVDALRGPITRTNGVRV